MNPHNALQSMTILTNAIGSNNTSTIRTIFNSLAQNKVKDMVSTTHDYLEMNRLENSADDALGNYILVTGAVQRGARYNRAFNAMKVLIERHGPNNTNSIRQQFNIMFN